MTGDQVPLLLFDGTDRFERDAEHVQSLGLAAGTDIGMRKRRSPIPLVVANRTSETTVLVLEPLGETYSIDAGQKRTVLVSGDLSLGLGLEIDDGELKIWAEGGAMLQLE
jgi:hypothetical protein